VKYKVYIVTLFLVLLSCSKSFQEKQKEADSLVNEAISLYNSGLYKQAEDSFLKAVDLDIELFRSDRLGPEYLYLGLINFNRARYDQSINFYRHALDQYSALNDSKNQCVVLTNMAGVYGFLNQYEKAIQYYNQSLGISSLTADKESQAVAYSSLGSVYDELEEYDRALAYYRRALIMNKISRDEAAETVNLNNMGETYVHCGVLDTASLYFQQALRLADFNRNGRMTGIIQNNVGLVKFLEGEHDAAAGAYKDGLIPSRLAGDPATEQKILSNIGDAYVQMFQYDRAVGLYAQALEIARGTSDRIAEGYLLNELGHAKMRLASTLEQPSLLDEALSYQRESMKVFQEVGYGRGESLVSYHLGMIAEVKGDKETAISYYRESIRLGEESFARGHVHDPNSTFNKNDLPYHELVSLLLRLGMYEEALQYLERSEVSHIRDQLRQLTVETRDSILNSEIRAASDLHREISVMDLELAARKSRKDQDKENMNNLQDAIARKKGEFYVHTKEVATRNPNLTWLFEIRIASLTEIQSALTEKSVILEYLPLDDSLWVFVITKQLLAVKRVSVRRDILKSQVNQYVDLVRQKDVNQQSRLLQDLAASLNGYLLKPFEDYTTLADRIIIVQSGDFSSLPFHALIQEDQSKNLRYLLETKKVSYLPSASFLRLRLPRNVVCSKVVGFANPRGDDESAEAEVGVLRSIFEKAEIYTRQQADRHAFERSVGDLLYISTEFLFNAKIPGKSSVSLSDGKIGLGKIFSTYSYPSVVLSHPGKTAGNPIVPELLLMNGSGDIVYNQWEKEDGATRFFLQAFYMELSKGAQVSEALRNAQLSMLGDRSYRNPRFWAAWFRIGD
jgi:tetratricopeptide (TPR) repeat protein